MKLDITKTLHLYEQCKEDGNHITRVTILFNHSQDVGEEDIRNNLEAQLDCFPCSHLITEIEREL